MGSDSDMIGSVLMVLMHGLCGGLESGPFGWLVWDILVFMVGSFGVFDGLCLDSLCAPGTSC